MPSGPSFWLELVQAGCWRGTERLQHFLQSQEQQAGSWAAVASVLRTWSPCSLTFLPSGRSLKQAAQLAIASIEFPGRGLSGEIPQALQLECVGSGAASLRSELFSMKEGE